MRSTNSTTQRRVRQLSWLRSKPKEPSEALLAALRHCGAGALAKQFLSLERQGKEVKVQLHVPIGSGNDALHAVASDRASEVAPSHTDDAVRLLVRQELVEDNHLRTAVDGHVHADGTLRKLLCNSCAEAVTIAAAFLSSVVSSSASTANCFVMSTIVMASVTS